MPRFGTFWQLFSFTVVLALLSVQPGATSAATAQPGNRQMTGGIAWFQDLYEAHQVSISTGRPMLIVFGASWCHYCKEMENTTLRNPQLVAYISANFIPVHIDADHDRRLVEILVKSKNIPCTVVLSPDVDLLGRIFGYQEVQEYINELEASRQRYAKLIQRRR